MKKLISIVLTIVIIMSAVCVSAESVNENYNTAALYEDTESTGFSASAEAELTVNDGVYTLKKKSSDRAWAHLTPGVDLSTCNYLKVTMDVKVNKACNGPAIAAYHQPKGNRSNLLAFSNVDGNFLENAEYTVNDWNTVTLYLDYSGATKKVVGYVNGNLAANKDVPSSPQGLTTFRIVIEDTTEDDVEVSFRNFKIYSSSDAIETTVTPGETTTTYTSVFKDEYNDYNKNSSLANDTAFSAIYGYGSGTNNVKMIVTDPDTTNENNYVLKLGASGTSTNEWFFRKGVLAEKAPGFHDNNETYISFMFYPTSDITRIIKMQGKDNASSREVGKMENGKVSFKDFSNSNVYTEVGSYDLNKWNTLTIKLKKRSDNKTLVDGTLKVNNEDEVKLGVDCWDKCIDYLKIENVATAESTLYIDNFEFGIGITTTTPDTYNYPDAILGQGTDSAIVFTSYQPKEGENSVTAIIAAYDIEGETKTLISATVLEPISLDGAAVQVKGTVASGNADLYRVFFLDDDETINPLAQPKAIPK